MIAALAFNVGFVCWVVLDIGCRVALHNVLQGIDSVNLFHCIIDNFDVHKIFKKINKGYCGNRKYSLIWSNLFSL